MILWLVCSEFAPGFTSKWIFSGCIGARVCTRVQMTVFSVFFLYWFSIQSAGTSLYCCFTILSRFQVCLFLCLTKEKKRKNYHKVGELWITVVTEKRKKMKRRTQRKRRWWQQTTQTSSCSYMLEPSCGLRWWMLLQKPLKGKKKRAGVEKTKTQWAKNSAQEETSWFPDDAPRDKAGGGLCDYRRGHRCRGLTPELERSSCFTITLRTHTWGWSWKLSLILERQRLCQESVRQSGCGPSLLGCGGMICFSYLIDLVKGDGHQKQTETADLSLNL